MKTLDKTEPPDYGDGLMVGNGMRMRPQVLSVYDRQVARCLSDIGQLYELPALVEDRIKKAIEFTCKDVDKLKSNPYGDSHDTESSGNR